MKNILNNTCEKNSKKTRNEEQLEDEVEKDAEWKITSKKNRRLKETKG